MEHFLHFMSQLDPGDTRPTSLLECMTEARNGGNLAAFTKAYHDREDDEDEEDFRFTMALYSACSNNEDGEAKRPKKTHSSQEEDPIRDD